MTDLQAIEKKLLLLTTRQRQRVFAFVLSLIKKADESEDAPKQPVTVQDD